MLPFEQFDNTEEDSDPFQSDPDEEESEGQDRPDFQSEPIFFLNSSAFSTRDPDVRDHHNRRPSESRGGGGSYAPIFLSLFEPSGGRLLYQADFDEEYKSRTFRHLKLITKNSGFINVLGGQISDQTNVKNIRISWDKEEDLFTVRLGDGTKRYYARQWKKKQDAHQSSHHTS